MEAREIRARFLEFFAEKKHTVVTSSSIIPQDDPTLLFINAGMNQFKGVFLGLEKRAYVRATSVQKCMRVSGKHNDLEEVGKDARHHTFFEMLGNWSFGDYYKREAIHWGWEFLTAVMGLPKERLWVSVYKDDDEAFAVWEKEIGLPAERIKRLGDLEQGNDENFWAMADTGPCGPCSEIHIDQGAQMACDHPEGCALGVCDCDRWLELWNLVFMQYNRDETGTLASLPMKSVDTGLGFERLVAVCQGVASNYETDLFAPLINKVAELSGVKPEGAARIAMQVIADHARAVSFTVADGAIPSNEGRGYVVRRILRRAARNGRHLDLTEPFLWKICEQVIAIMGDAYPELIEQRERVLKIVRTEEERFNRTLDSGLQIYDDIQKRMQREGRTVMSGEDAFRLHDTYGFPCDLTAVVAAEDGFTVDEAGFKVCMERQRAASTSERTFMAGIGAWEPLNGGELKSRFIGYDRLAAETSPLAVRAGGELPEGGPVSHLLFAENPFYAESGGQVGDRGTIELSIGERWNVLTTIKSEEGPVCVVAGAPAELIAKLRAAESVTLRVDGPARLATMRHHTATHLLHAALRDVLGDHVEQAGSEVGPEKLRFDFRHDPALTADELRRIEQIVNERVQANRTVAAHDDVPLDEARERGAMALFGEKYGDRVRMIEIFSGNPVETEAAKAFSLELCGGTHCTLTGDIGLVRIVSESSSAAGIRRIEAVAGDPALELMAREHGELAGLSAVLRADGGAYVEQVTALVAERDALRKEVQKLSRRSAEAALENALASPQDVNGLKLVAAQVSAESRDTLMELGDHVRAKLGSGVVVLATEMGPKAMMIAAVTNDLVEAKRIHAGNLIKALAQRVGGRGGGRPGMAQAGLAPDQIPEIIAAVAEVVAEIDAG